MKLKELMTEQNLNLRHLGNCGHKSCECVVDAGLTYCSEQCEQADNGMDSVPHDHTSACECGHTDCK